MREILFRGKRLDNGEWIEGAFFPESDPYPATIFHGKHNSLGDYVDPATVGQFTGLVDKNGKRIFEGDIVRMCFIDTEEVGEIVWDEERCKFAYDSPDGETYGVDGTVEIEILGNIHDNPERLEGGQT